MFVETPDASYAIATHVLLAIHVLFVNILLTNLLIAMFRYAWHGCVCLVSCCIRFFSANDSIRSTTRQRISGTLNSIFLPESTTLVHRWFRRSAYSMIRIDSFAWVFSASGRHATAATILRKKRSVSPRQCLLSSPQQYSCPSSGTEMIATKKEQVDDWGAFEGASTYEYAHTQAKESRVKTTA